MTDQAPRRRCRGSDGTALVAALVLLFAFTSVGVVLLARDYDDRVARRSSAQAIAFQAARTGAQQIDIEQLRLDGSLVLEVDVARSVAESTGRRLLAEYGEEGTVVATVEIDRVVVVVEISDVIDQGFSTSRNGVIRAEGAARATSG